MKPAVLKHLLDLQNVKLDLLSCEKLIEHIQNCFETTQQMVEIHHRLTYTAFIPIGDFIRQVSAWTGAEPLDILDTLNRSNTNRLSSIYADPFAQEWIAALGRSPAALCLLSKVEQEPERAGWVLESLCAFGGCIERGLRQFVEDFGYRIVNGYDITAETYIERKDLLLKSIKAMLRVAQIDHGHQINALIDQTPPEKRSLLMELLHDAQEMGRLRNERGMYSDLWAIGILRHAYLEAGRRLVQSQMIPLTDLAFDATLFELISLLKGVPAVSSDALQERAGYRDRYSVSDAPAILGHSDQASYSLSHLPDSLSRTMAGLMTAMTLAVEHVQRAKSKDTLVGVPAARGEVEGTVKVIRSDQQIGEIKRGDILVIAQSTAALDIVFPLIKGIISQYGGVLSHPAILAREYGIPCIVGCSDAFDSLQTGMVIHLDGDKGLVKTLAAQNDAKTRLESLQCEYSGAMQGRNRDRVFNHLGAVSTKLEVIAALRQDENSSKILKSHFEGNISTDEAVDRITGQHSQVLNKIPIQSLERFVQRLHLEFHPCDACNLYCSGCTYQQDTPLRPVPESFPFEQVSKICAVIQPKAITVVGGGEPTLYRSQQQSLGDLICALGQGRFGCRPDLGLISNGVLWPPGNPQWHHSLKWIRYSVDASSAETYARIKGKDCFDLIIDNVFRLLTQTQIPQVGVGFLYHPGNIVEAGPLIAYLAKRIRDTCPDQVSRLNVQFRPWRMPTGRPSIQEKILSREDVAFAANTLFSYIDQDPFIEQFTRQNTNIAVNLLCGGAREKVKPFSDCFFGLAKLVVRADGSIYPCFRMAANQDERFYCGNILEDSPLKIALRSLHVIVDSVHQVCTSEFDKCLFCVFNNALESGLTGRVQLDQKLVGDYFF
jgi:radical SAM protein with 4Fe4S-binding SPASM domain